MTSSWVEVGVGEISGWAMVGDGGRCGGVVELGPGDCGKVMSSEVSIVTIERGQIYQNE